MSLEEQSVRLSLDWQQENLDSLQDHARQAFVNAEETERLLRYHQQLVEISYNFPLQTTTVGLNDFLRPLFAHAAIATANGANPVLENRAVFIIMTVYLSDLELGQLTGDSVPPDQPREIRLVIDSRQDIARHVVSSAAIAASAGVTTADVLSVYKEVHDARYRTGFSFADIAANQVGAAMGRIASHNPDDARLFQELMQSSLTEADYMPALDGFDEGLTEQEFADRYGDRNSPAYQAKLEEIAVSVASRPLFLEFDN